MNEHNLGRFIKGVTSAHVFVLCTILVMLAPVLLFGHPGFYGDDLNFAGTIREIGWWNGLISWTHEYGIFYRPLGAAFLYLVYGIFGSSEAWMYGIILFTYTCLAYVLYQTFYKATKDVVLSGYMLFFFACFPLNSTAFLQLSSIYQIFAALLLVFFLGLWIKRFDQLTSSVLWKFALVWILLLLTYEQITGLVVILILLVIFLNATKTNKHLARIVLRTMVFMGGATVLFMGMYVFTPGNPKISTLKSLNQKVSSTQAQAMISTVDISRSQGSKVIIPISRLSFIQKKITKVSDFFISNITYALKNFLQYPVRALVVMSLLILLIVSVMGTPSVRPSQRRSLVYLLLGSCWFSVTFAPFLLYKAVSVPPYVLMLPSIGLGLAIYGLYWFCAPAILGRFCRPVFKVALITVMLLFPLQQYGYYFGLKEELFFWRNVALQLGEDKDKLLTPGKVIVIKDVLLKHNLHIFWLEDAIGKRYFCNLLGERYLSLSVLHDKDNHHVVLSFPEKLSSEGN